MRNILLFVAITSILFTTAQDLIRGPYLQSMASTSVKIMWRTSLPTNSVIHYGTSYSNLTNSIIDTNQVSNHIIKIEGLLPNTKYYYSIGYNNTTLAGTNEQHHFVTAPNIGDTSGFKFWVTGDFGAKNNEQIRVRQWFENYISNNNVTGWLWLGDNAYDNGTDFEYQTKVFSSDYGYDSIFRFLPFYPIPGNHDYGSVNQTRPAEQHTGPYYNMVEVFKNGEMGGIPSNTEAYYSYDYGNVHFIALNSELYNYLLFWNLGNPYKNWIENDLKNTTQPFKVAYWHQPPYSKGSHDSDQGFEVFMKAMREKINPILEQYGVDLVLCGHSHVYERSYLINKHYGLSSSFNRTTMLIDSTSGNPDSNKVYLKYTYGNNKDKGTVYAVVGNSGKHEEENGKMHPIMYKKYSDEGDGGVGSMIFEANGKELTCYYYKANGELLDKFRIKKIDSIQVISSIKESNEIEELFIYPNPFDTKIKIEFSSVINGNAHIYLQNTNGELVLNKLWEGSISKGKNYIELTRLDTIAKGEYIISILCNDNIIAYKLLKL